MLAPHFGRTNNSALVHYSSPPVSGPEAGATSPALEGDAAVRTQAGGAGPPVETDAAAPPTQNVNLWEPVAVYLITLLVLALLTPRVVAHLSPATGDEPFYLMTAISILEDRDINECNNYRERDEARLYPASLVRDRVLPNGWVGWNAVPYPLPPHPARIIPEERRCFGTNVDPLVRGIPDTNFPLPPDGTENELYSKHGLGLSLLVTLPFALGDRM